MMPTVFDSTTPPSLDLLPDVQQQERFSRLPFWVWFVLIAIVIIVTIIVTLRKDEMLVAEQSHVPVPPPPDPQPVPQPMAAFQPSPQTQVVKPVVAATPPRPDNLKRIKGIGPKIEKLLKEKGVTTFAQIAKMEVSEIQTLLDTVDWSDLADPTTWPEQAKEFVEAKKKDHKN